MNRYDPDRAPDPDQWLSLDEQMRIELVEKYHRAARIELPNVKAHAVFHAIVENQIAENSESVVRAMSRLIGEGLTRHEALHAISSVLAAHIHALFNAKSDQGSSAGHYDAALDVLSAKNWRGR